MSEIPEHLKTLLQPGPRTKPERLSPKVLLIYGPKKHGKTQILAHVPDCRIVDLEYAEGGTGFLKQLPYEPFRPKSLTEFEQFCKECATYRPYRVVAFDPLDTLEDWAIDRSTAFFKNSPIGKGFIASGAWDGKNILTVPGRDGGGGPGWGYLRAEMRTLLVMTMGVADKVIWVGHMKDKLGEEKKVRENDSADIDLVGKARAMVTGTADAFALVIRSATHPDKLMMTFRYKGNTVQGGGGGRCDHLEGQELIISEKQADGSLKVNWHLVYPDLFETSKEIKL